MWILRLIILLSIVALFLPSTPEEKQQMYRGVSDAVDNVQGVCVRNAELCDSVVTIATAIADRFYYGAQMLYDATLSGSGQAPRGASEWPNATPKEGRLPGRETRAPSGPVRSTPTLRQDDLAPAWRGPGAS